ncbi:MAG: S4 domain-containing protein YaaA [Bacilli bacterium]|nr:S4 domain-containing protein YaaA [Bacilli bacterium]
MTTTTVKLRENQEYVTLNVVLKLSGVISTGGMAKIFLQNNPVVVNGENENRRGRKLYHGDVVEVENKKIVIE